MPALGKRLFDAAVGGRRAFMTQTENTPAVAQLLAKPEMLSDPDFLAKLHRFAFDSQMQISELKDFMARYAKPGTDWRKLDKVARQMFDAQNAGTRT